MRQRLDRPEPFDYSAAVRTNETWPDHRLRTLVTAAAIAWLTPDSILDVACGDASIVRAAQRLHAMKHIYLNDVSEAQVASLKDAAGLALALANTKFGSMDAHHLLESVTGKVDVIVMTEFLEHVEDPDELLRLAATKARFLVASSPEMRPGQIDINPEHLWSFDRDGYRGLLGGNGWITRQYTHLNFPTEYDFQIWVAEVAA